MQNEKFIKDIAKYVVKYAPKHDIKVCSPIIAQAILESDCGKSELAMQAKNYFGLKFVRGRCKTSTGVFYLDNSEQNPWCIFENMQNAVIGYFDFISIGRYAKLKNIENPKAYTEALVKAGFTRDKSYVDKIMKVIKKYNLTQYDKNEEVEKLYRCITSAYSIKEVAKKEVDSLKKIYGINATIFEHNKKFMVQAGAYKVQENATKKANDMKTKGLEVHVKHL